MIIIRCKKWYLDRSYLSITLFPFIFVQHDKINDILINHEKIHIYQQIELLILGFYIWYGINYLYNYLKYKNWDKAYKNIIFEKEAYSFEKDFNYIKSRKFLGFLKKY